MPSRSRAAAAACSPEPEPQAVLRVADARVFAALLGSIRAPTRPQVKKRIGRERERSIGVTKIDLDRDLASHTHTKENSASASFQLCALNITQEGLALAWQDPSKSARSSLYLGRDAFSKFDVPSSWGGDEDEDDGDENDESNFDGGRATVDLHTFADTAALFAALAGVGVSSGGTDALELRYPGPNGEIEFEMGGGGSGALPSRASLSNPANLVSSSPSPSSRTYARVGTADSDPASVAAAAAAAAEDAAAAAAASRGREGLESGGNGGGGGGGGGGSVFIAPSPLLREAVSDLEWAAGTGGGGGSSNSSSGGGTASLTLVRDPPRASLSASCVGGSLSVELPPSALASFAVGGSLVRHGYRFRHLRAALAPPVSILSAGGGGGGGGGSAAAGGGGSRHDASRSAAGGLGEPPPPAASSKVAVDPSGVLRVTHIVPLPGYSSTGASRNNAVIQFVMYSCVEEEEEEEEDLADGGGGGAAAARSRR